MNGTRSWLSRGARVQPLCSGCGRELRYPGQRWGKRCFALYHREQRHRLRVLKQQERNAEVVPEGSETTTTNNIPRSDNKRRYALLIEQAKRMVAEIAKYPNRPETIRVSLFPRGHHTYIDLRVYLAGKPTGKGLAIHHDLLPQVIAALQQALHEDWNRLHAQDNDRDGESAWGEGYTAVRLPPDFW